MLPTTNKEALLDKGYGIPMASKLCDTTYSL